MTTVSPAKSTVTVLLIEDSPEYAALVQNWLAAKTDINFVLNWTDTLQAGLNRLKSGVVDVILLDLTLPDSTGLATFTNVKQQAGRVPIIPLSSEDSEQTALQMVQAGAQDYIVKSSCGTDRLAKSIQYALARADSQAESAAGRVEDQSSVIGVMGVRGGVGCTTIACNLAAELRRQTDKTTLLADLDLDGGLASFMLGVESEYSLLDATGNVDRLDASFWGGIVADCAGGLDVLCSPSQLGVAAPDAASLGFVVALVRKIYRWSVVDLGRPSSFSLGLLDKVTDLLVVTTTSILSLYEARRTIDSMRDAGFDGDRIKLIVNQVSNIPEYRGSEFDKLFGVGVYAKFSPSAKELHESCLQRKPPARNSDFRIQMSALASKMAGLTPEKPRSMVSQLFSFSGKVGAESHSTKDSPSATSKVGVL
jgi:Flp pilus assembly CpaE family ATPase